MYSLVNDRVVVVVGEGEHVDLDACLAADVYACVGVWSYVCVYVDMNSRICVCMQMCVHTDVLTYRHARV